MGRFAKNYEIKTGSHAVRLPLGSNSVGPDLAVEGQVRFNSDNPLGFEFFHNNAWHSSAVSGRVQIVRDSFTGDGTTLTFTPMSVAHTDPKDILVFISGVFQDPATAYTVSGVNITFTSAPPIPTFGATSVVILHNFNSTNAV